MENDINKKITIDVEVTSDGQQQIAQYKIALDNLRISVSNLSNPFGKLSGSISNLDKDMQKLAGSVDKLNKQNKETESSGNKVKESVKGLSEMFEIFAKAIKFVKDGVVTLEDALTGGLSILVTFLPEITSFISSLIKGKKAIDQAKLSVDTMNEALESSDYSNAVEQLDELKINVGLAKQGFLDKKEVLKEYNDMLGQTMGQAANLDMAETTMVTKGDAYIKMTLLKASAQLALQDAAKKAYEAEQAKNKSDEDSLTFLDKVRLAPKALINTMLSGTPLNGPFDAKKIIEDEQKIAAQRRAEAVAEAEDQGKAFLTIVAKFKKEAADIARENGFDPLGGKNGGHGSGNGGQLKQQQADALKETEKLFSDSRARQLQATYDAYGNETMAENQHYQDELKRLRELLSKKLISKEQCAKVSQQLDIEHHNTIASIIDKYKEQDKEKTEQAATELEELKINAMQDGAEKQKAQRDFQQKQALLQIDKADAELRARAKKLSVELANILMLNPLADTSAIAGQLSAINTLIDFNKQKRSLIESTGTKNTDKEKADAADKENLKKLKGKVDEDTEAVDLAKTSGAKFKGERALIDDKFQYELAQAGNNAEKKKELEKKHQKDITDITKKAEQERKDFGFKIAEQLSAAAFSIVTANIKHQSEAKIAGLEKDKTNELSNSSLTSAQKLSIENKYKKQEAAIKVKAFKDEQKASIAQALINGAIAITKAEAQTGVLGTFVIPGIIAETAIQVAKIASQKPPAYARGGLHYQSDGRGGVLPGYSRTDNTNAHLRSGEGVVVSEAMQVPWARNLVSAINVGFGGRDFSIANPGRGYAVGGIFTDGGDANRYYNQPVNDQKNLANTIAYQMINNFPPVYVDVKDINNEQNILAQTVNRVNL